MDYAVLYNVRAHPPPGGGYGAMRIVEFFV